MHRREFLTGTAVTLAAASQSWLWAKPQEPLADSWASFRNGPQQLGLAKTKLPEKLELLWKTAAGDKDAMVPATAAIANGRVYVPSLNGTVLCLDLKSGKPVWKEPYASRERKKKDEFIPGFKAPVTVTADSVYLGDEEGWFHAIDRDTGTQRWKPFETGAEILSAATPFEDTILFGSYDSNLYCLRMGDGTKAWQFTTQDRVNGSPAVSGHYTFVTGCDSHLRVVDCRTGKEESAMELGSYVIASPAVDGDMLYVGNHGAEMLAIDWRKKQVVWTYKDPSREFPYHSSAAVTDKYVIVGGHDKRVHCIDRQTGKKVWTFNTRGKVNSSPVVVDNRIFVGSDDGTLYGLTLAGKEIFRHVDGRPFSASPAIGEGCLVIGSESEKGMVYCFGKA